MNSGKKGSLGKMSRMFLKKSHMLSFALWLHDNIQLQKRHKNDISVHSASFLIANHDKRKQGIYILNLIIP